MHAWLGAGGAECREVGDKYRSSAEHLCVTFSIAIYYSALARSGVVGVRDRSTFQIQGTGRHLLRRNRAEQRNLRGSGMISSWNSTVCQIVLNIRG